MAKEKEVKLTKKTKLKKEGQKNKKVKSKTTLNLKEKRSNKMTETKKEVKKEKTEKKSRKPLLSEKTKRRLKSTAKTIGRGVGNVVVGSLSVALGLWVGKQIPTIVNNGNNDNDVL